MAVTPRSTDEQERALALPAEADVVIALATGAVGHAEGGGAAKGLNLTGVHRRRGVTA
ncbi:hypothetical protein FHX81_3489 [Saccharothrix saharensis]|uniref:Uncharacterized protein n=1 Tax=Saccharothrix saharensis TaxID=571190 RepID=A0A543JE42_9PSEU|nr:hypothetical protein [Saccharothrix saharensis]TQM81128.1 hypothetical protein FHX81_3489 [Saccharothrix saharensis]